ncbi:MAG TPA: glycosyltransferase family 4 protein [Bryobacteraceae bacterium]|nr:glycosyltransferase family 4 protein [Bryobacteraceae bacterium]
MRVLHLDAGREMRGGQWQVLRLIEGLAAHGVESTLLARAAGPLFESARGRGMRVEPMGFVRTLLTRGYDVVHAHDARGHTIAALAGAAPLVVSRRVAFDIRSPWKYKRARRFIAVSHFVKSVLERGAVPGEKIGVVYDGVPLLKPSSGSAVIAPASADPLKATPLTLDAARLASVELKLSTALERDLGDAGVFVYITESEGLGSGALLAMAAGVPVIASKVGGLPEIVVHRETGLLVDNDAAAIAEAIRELRAGPDLARRLGEAGRKRVQENFTVDHMVRRTMEVYRQVLT